MEPASSGIGANRWEGHAAGLTNKIHAVVDSNGLPVRLALTVQPIIQRDASDERSSFFVEHGQRISARPLHRKRLKMGLQPSILRTGARSGKQPEECGCLRIYT